MRGDSGLGYLRDPERIYAESFAIIRAEAKLNGLPPAIAAIAERLMHACGMTDLVPELRFDPAIGDSALAALNDDAAILTDCEMAQKAIVAARLPARNQIICMLNDASVPELARRLATTRSAAAVSLWPARLSQAVAVIGNAPTALFALLEGLDSGWPKPAAIIAFPVGFVGAAEAKQELARDSRGVPFITLLGRRGGSAMAGAAVNAITGGAAGWPTGER
ncbi:MAG TPA: precorrin-8X methylmutase [Aestuariivirgaceae bacterium]|jgi:precorrin isomerase|nr:precorrin-8X methylmutase [Aestuariivirgaceae bacterium]